MKRTFFITTPIYYASGPPHIGHLYTTTLADAYHRFQKIQGHNSILSTGTDEHGYKIQKKAWEKQMKPKLYVDQISKQYSDLFTQSRIDFTDFIRTTDPRHCEKVQELWRHMSERGLIHKKQHQGWYCVPDETFVPEEQTESNERDERISKESGHPVEWTQEDNYVFNIADFQDQIRDWLHQQSVITPKLFLSSLDSLLAVKIPELSLSRPTSRVSWGIPVPDDPSQSIYVWFDALLNYLTVGESHGTWPADIHVVGKDILRFHAIYLPAFLMANGLDLPKRLMCHSHWTVGGKKMSKSLGNIVDPHEAMAQVGAEGLRYYLLRQGVPGTDNNFDQDKVLHYFNHELADTLGNLLSRSGGKKVNKAQVRQPFDPDLLQSPLGRSIRDMWHQMGDQVGHSYEDFNFYQGITTIMDLLRNTNGFFDEQKPWTIKDESPEKDLTVQVSLESLRRAGILLQPIIPDISNALLDKLNVQDRAWSALASPDSEPKPLNMGQSVLVQKIYTQS
eukprot:maker-scaffold60_size442463-snap-gene-0.25 protein:Tk12068 transcript:maker-scaffold60_size442463-snap-gene-0.25-mRNA-1 annotation:"AGAP002383-PA"